MKRVIVAITMLMALVVAGQAGAANYKMFLGEQTMPPKGTPKGATLDEFLPGNITIVAGDKVTFSSASFHTVTYGIKPPALLVPDPGKSKLAGFMDSAGTPFWFNGLAKWIYNGPAFAPFGPKTISGNTPASSGPLSPSGNSPATFKPGTATYTFPTAGTYNLICTIHPNMTGIVVVKPAGSTAPLSPTQVHAEALKLQAPG
jgi:plastocyanin